MYYCTSYKILKQEHRHSLGMKSPNWDMVVDDSFLFPTCWLHLFSLIINCLLYFLDFIVNCCSVTQSCLTLCGVDCTRWTAACQASLSFTISRSLLKLMSIESMMPSNHLISVIPFSSRLLSFPASSSFPMRWLFASGGQSIGASASGLPMNIQD